MVRGVVTALFVLSCWSSPVRAAITSSTRVSSLLADLASDGLSVDTLQVRFVLPISLDIQASNGLKDSCCFFQSEFDGLTYDTTAIDGPATLDQVNNTTHSLRYFTPSYSYDCQFPLSLGGPPRLQSFVFVVCAKAQSLYFVAGRQVVAEVSNYQVSDVATQVRHRVRTDHSRKWAWRFFGGVLQEERTHL